MVDADSSSSSVLVWWLAILFEAGAVGRPGHGPSQGVIFALYEHLRQLLVVVVATC